MPSPDMSAVGAALMAGMEFGKNNVLNIYTYFHYDCQLPQNYGRI